MKQTLYMACTPDRYELPVAVAESVSELARMLHKEQRQLINVRAKQRSMGVKMTNRKPEYIYHDVEVEV